MQLEKTVALLFVPQREERIGPRDAQRLAHLVLAAGRRPLRFAEHEIGGGVLGIQPRHTGNDVVVAVENQQDVGRPDIPGIFHPPQRRQLKGGAAVLRVARVEEVDGAAVLFLRDVLQVRVPLRHSAIDGRLVFRVEAKGLRKATVLRAKDLALRHQGNEVVLHGLGVVLSREGCRRLARPTQSHDEDHALLGSHRDDFATGVHREPPGVVDLLVPHAQSAFLRLTEVVGVEDARDAGLEVDEHRPVVGIAGRRQVRRDNHRHFWLLAGGGRIVQVPLHSRDVGVASLDDQAGRGEEARIVSDDAIQQHHFLVMDVRVLELGPLPAFFGRHGLRGMLLRSIRDDVGALGAARIDARVDVVVVVNGAPRVRHPGGELSKLFGGRVVDQTLGLRDIPAADLDGH